MHFRHVTAGWSYGVSDATLSDVNLFNESFEEMDQDNNKY